MRYLGGTKEQIKLFDGLVDSLEAQVEERRLQLQKALLIYLIGSRATYET